MIIKNTIEQEALNAAINLYGVDENTSVPVQKTRKEFEGDYTIVVFPFTRAARKKPDAIAEEIGAELKNAIPEVESFNVVKGFLNLKLTNEFWVNEIGALQSGSKPRVEKVAEPDNIMVEYSSPNTNKPLHLGHVRNNLLGYSISQIFEARGHKVTKANLVNDRGIHICKSMLAYQKVCKQKGTEITPNNFSEIYPEIDFNAKGDKLVGFFYVEFENSLRREFEGRVKDAPMFSSYNSQSAEKLRNITTSLFGHDRFSNDVNELTISGSLASYVNSHISEFSTSANKKPNNLDNFDYVYDITASGIQGDLDAFKNQAQNLYIPAEKVDTIWFRISNVVSGIKGNIKKDKKEQKSEFFKFLRENSDLYDNARQLLLQWEAGYPEVIDLWKKMNEWVLKGHEQTYKELGVNFDQFYFESNTYLLGKDIINEGLKKGVFYKKDDGSVWCDLSADGLDKKLVLRSDGTSVYMTQDIGTAELKYEDYEINRSLYVVGDEQEYHFKVLKLIMQKLGRPYADGIYHLSYGMIDLPSGRMKSREGTVVDADDLIAEMREVAKKQTEELGKTDSLKEDELEQLYSNLGLGALKYFLLKVDPKRRMVFNPEESIDFQGNTGPFIQYNFTRIKSVERKLGKSLAEISITETPEALTAQERELCMMLCSFNEVLEDAENSYSPAVIANYCYDLAKTFSSFYAESPVIRETDDAKRNFRLALIHQIEETLAFATSLLGITLPERM